MKDKAPTWLKKVNQNVPIIKPKIEIITPALLIDKEKGEKFINLFFLCAIYRLWHGRFFEARSRKFE